MERGVIRNRAHATQVRDFRKLRFGNITPTDIDMLIEYRNLGWVYGELKFVGAELPFGQRLAMERMCDDLARAKPTLGIVAQHNTSGDIDVAEAIVTEMRWQARWVVPAERTTVKELVDRFVKWLEMEKLIK